jgi:hypothetical protein
MLFETGPAVFRRVLNPLCGPLARCRWAAARPPAMSQLRCPIMSRLLLFVVLFQATDGGTMDFEESLGTEAVVRVRTSLAENAATSGTITITLYGDRSVSPPLTLGSGFSGDQEIALRVDDDLGVLRKIRLSTDSSDGWLVASIDISIASTVFTFANAELFWLDKPDDTAGLASRWESTAPGGGPTEGVREMLELYAHPASTARDYPR